MLKFINITLVTMMYNLYPHTHTHTHTHINYKAEDIIKISI